MGSWLRQIEFRWNAWQAVKPSQKPGPRSILGHDTGLTVWCVETANSLGLPELARKVRVSWNARMQTTAGRAWWPDRTIELNPKLKEVAPEELWRTIRHELAHLVAYERCGRRRIEPHGPEWQAACADLGIPNDQPYHTLPFKRKRMQRKYVYSCPWCFESFRRVKKIRRMVACYNCCQKHSQGHFDIRFKLIEEKIGQPKV
jgi:predicted SprT family Zn-dependent metalloprotease